MLYWLFRFAVVSCFENVLYSYRSNRGFLCRILIKDVGLLELDFGEMTGTPNVLPKSYSGTH